MTLVSLSFHSRQQLHLCDKLRALVENLPPKCCEDQTGKHNHSSFSAGPHFITDLQLKAIRAQTPPGCLLTSRHYTHDCYDDVEKRLSDLSPTSSIAPVLWHRNGREEKLRRVHGEFNYISMDDGGRRCSGTRARILQLCV